MEYNKVSNLLQNFKKNLSKLCSDNEEVKSENQNANFCNSKSSHGPKKWINDPELIESIGNYLQQNGIYEMKRAKV